MLNKKYKTDVGTDFYGSSEAERIKYIWESFKRICKSDFVCVAFNRQHLSGKWWKLQCRHKIISYVGDHPWEAGKNGAQFKRTLLVTFRRLNLLPQRYSGVMVENTQIWLNLVWASKWSLFPRSCTSLRLQQDHRIIPEIVEGIQGEAISDNF